MKEKLSRILRGNEGSAFVISILVLFVLSVLGLALMLTTTTEKDIAINYRWGEQAFFNADAALEYGKNVLAAYALVNQDFAAILPPARADVTVIDNTQPWGTAHPDPVACVPSGAGCRDYQYFIDQCPTGGGACTRIYIGRVLRRQDGTQAMWDFRAPAGAPGDLDNDGAIDVQGTTTLWIRRPIVG
ncbi:MAG: pilus assembly PilX family protein, partial [Vicinamibacteria bacterium]